MTGPGTGDGRHQREAPEGDFYRELTDRNLGFVDDAEQERLRRSRVFVCGVGGMGGTAVQCLVRAGVGALSIADIDRFEASNLNRQAFAFTDTLGRRKVDAVREGVLRINPEVRIDVWGEDWVDALDEILSEHPVVVNGMDDVGSGIRLYRKAREQGATVVDAYASPLPSVTVVGPGDPRPEERLGYPTAGSPWSQLAPDVERTCLLREIEYVLIHSSAARHIDLEVAREFLAGRRSRSSFAPTVTIAGSLMALETINRILERPYAADHRGYFFNPWTGRVERPRRAPTAGIRRLLVRRFLNRLTHGI